MPSCTLPCLSSLSRSPRRPLRRVVLSVLAGAATVAGAQDLTPKAPAQAGPIVIVGATVHPVSGPAIEDGVVWFDGGVIAGVSTAAEFRDLETRVRWRAPLTRVDAGGKHVYPGLIAPYSQLGLTEIQSIQQTVDTSEAGGVSPEVRAVVAVNPDSTLLPVTRSNGVLTAGVFPTGGTVSGQPSVIRLDGWTTPEMTVEESIGIVMRWPNVRPFESRFFGRGEGQSDEEQAKAIRRNLDEVERIFDTAAAYAAAKAADPAAPTDLRWEGMRSVFPARDAAAGGAPAGRLYVLAQDVDQITSAVAFATARGIRVVIVGGRDAPMCAELLKRHEVPVIVLGTHVLPRRDDAGYDEPYTLPARLEAAGIAFAIANNDDTAHERNLPYSAAMAAAHGLDRERALRAVTLSAAEVLGVADRLGSLEVGKSATLLVTDGDPLAVTTKVERAYIDGRAIDLSNKQTKLAEKYRGRYRDAAATKPRSGQDADERR